MALVVMHLGWRLVRPFQTYGLLLTVDQLMMSVLSPWNWFCSTRTFSNSLETALTIVAMYFWPWKISSDTVLGAGSDPSQAIQKSTTPAEKSDLKVFSSAKTVNQ
jgi:phosphatidylinositol glycan class B